MHALRFGQSHELGLRKDFWLDFWEGKSSRLLLQYIVYTSHKALSPKGYSRIVKLCAWVNDFP